jgi:Holliday junction resolvase RusA-like endonuclease
VTGFKKAWSERQELIDRSRRVVRVPVVPMGKPRMTRSDKWKKRPAVVQYRAFADTLRLHAKKAKFAIPDQGMRIEFLIPMPESWSEKKKQAMEGTPHQQKPDLDNLEKAVLDAMCGEDCTVWQIVGSEKRWSRDGAITFEVFA